MNLWFIIMSILFIYLIDKELQVLNYSKLNAFILIYSMACILKVLQYVSIHMNHI